ncbi:ISSfl3 ORF [Shewanella benthica KT99]|uniref:ISSfl3 ORF n=1 Tax=Shewanella benthica KT99 TaxID=314608 RepID=A9DG48_9GAMM|nr:ISSfl3 ORF [Shewanella benthica KT99]
MNGGSLSITGLGRDIDSNALEKHKIKRVDRLCSNTKLHRDIKLIYTRMAYLLVSKMPQPIIHIDWSDLDGRKESFLIRFSLAGALQLRESLSAMLLECKLRRALGM